jgi:hypothetical protein
LNNCLIQLEKSKRLLKLIIKATLVAFFFVSLCRSFNEKNELETDEDDMNKLNDWNGTLNVKTKPRTAKLKI